MKGWVPHFQIQVSIKIGLTIYENPLGFSSLKFLILWYKDYMRKQQVCSICNTPHSYSGRWDSFYCSNCDTWAEGKCDFPSSKPCSYCEGRPDKPSLDPELRVRSSMVRATAS